MCQDACLIHGDNRFTLCSGLNFQLVIDFSYPGKIAELLHRTNAYVPVGVAALLKEKPNLISAAVLAFCNRDPIDMKVRSHYWLCF
jgi:hypothetical protein